MPKKRLTIEELEAGKPEHHYVALGKNKIITVSPNSGLSMNQSTVDRNNIHHFNIKAYKKIFEEALELSIRKNNAYGKNNISALGIKGVFVRMWRL